MTGTLNLLVFQVHSFLVNGGRRTSDGHGRSVCRRHSLQSLALAKDQTQNCFRGHINQASLKEGACVRHGAGVC